MSNISKPNTFSADTTASSSEVNANFDTIYNDYNGNIDANNLASDAVTTAKIADGAVTAAKLAEGIVDSGWAAFTGTHSVATTYNAGNRSFTIDTSEDHTGSLSEGMRYKVTRGTTPPTQCADLEASSSQYASKSSPAGMTLGTTISCEAWINLESYNAGEIEGRYSSGGWIFRINSSGQVSLVAGDGADNDEIVSYQSVSLNKWVHVAATHTINSGGAIYIGGVSVPVTFDNGTTTTISEAGDLTVGARSGGSLFFDGKLADVRVWSDIRSATEIQDNMYAYPSDTTGLVGHFKGDGDWTDSSANGNDLTASGGAGFATDNPWNATEYGIITAVSATDIQVFCPEGYGIPNETLSSPFYSTQSAPYGFPRDEGRWELQVLSFENIVPTVSTTPQDSNLELQVPVGAWSVTLDLFLVITSSTTGSRVGNATLSTDGSTETNVLLTGSVWSDEDAAISVSHGNTVACRESVSLSASTTYTLLMYVNNVSNVDQLQTRGDNSTTIIRAISAYL